MDHPELVQRIRDELASNEPPRDILVELVRMVDTVFVARRGPQAVRRVIAEMVCTLGEALDGGGGGIGRTTAAARRYLERPEAERWGALYEAATMTYPFGPGEGCLALVELGGHGARGAGCASGVGFIASTGLDDALVVELLRAYFAAEQADA